MTTPCQIIYVDPWHDCDHRQMLYSLIKRVLMWHAGGSQTLRHDLMTSLFPGRTIRSRGFSWHAGRQSLCLDLMTYPFSGSTMRSRGFSCGMLEAVLTSQFDDLSFPREHNAIQSVFHGMREGRPYVSI